ncbi:MAG: cytochrome c peroxidase [Polyangiaceae bacterium]|jgi:cytochrome c peroxidase
MTQGQASARSAPLAAASGKRRHAFGKATACLVSFVAGLGCQKHAEREPGGGSESAWPGLLGSHAATAIAVRPAEAPPIVDPIPPHTVPTLTPREEVGRFIFLDATLSNPPGTSCASCHDPRAAFSGNNGSVTGVARGSRPGHFALRNAPSVMYLKFVPPFHFALEDDDDVEESPFGGLTWSGRADTVAEFARIPLFDANEMNAKSEAEIASKLGAAPYAADLTREYPGALTTPASAMKAFGEALQAFLTSEAMSPFTSKFDDFLRGKAQLSPLEIKGMRAFENREKGSCQHCHPMHEGWNRPEGSLFTTYSYDSVGVPRNHAIAANADAKHYDLGLCERTQKKEPSSDEKWCGSFRIPSLRNVAVRQRFMHNGAFSKLRDVVTFYATRSTNPDLFYPHGAKFDDAPERYRRNVNTFSLPYNRREGGPPALDDADVDAIVAFLETLTDAPYRDVPHRDVP